MTICRSDRADYRALLAALPTLDAGVELILRPTANGATATLRRDDAPPRLFATTPAGVVERFPHEDGELSGAPLLGDADRLAAAFAPLLGDLEDSRLVAWRPGRRAVVRLATTRGVFWLKLLDAKSWRRAARAFAAVGAPLAPLRLATPLALRPELCGYVAASAPGVPLRNLLATGEVAMTTLARSVMALAYTQVAGELPVLDFQKARAATLGSLQNALSLRPDLGDLAQRLAALVAVPAPAPVGFVHGDLHDKQIFVDADGATVIDLEGMGVGDPRFDVVNLAEHLRLRERQRGEPDSGRADELLSRCGLCPDDAVTLAFRAVVRARLCGVYALRPRWTRLVDVLHTEVQDLLERLS